MSHPKTQKRSNALHNLSLDFVTPMSDRGYIHDSEKRRVVSQILNMITETERRVLTFKSIGFDYNEIADEIHVSSKTAESIMTKLRTRMIALFPEIAAVYGAEVSYAC
jgi:DNA-directed RNA polymerase specialized sigma24 family protein